MLLVFRAISVTRVLIFRATNKLMLWYIEQQENLYHNLSYSENIIFLFCENFLDQKVETT